MKNKYKLTITIILVSILAITFIIKNKVNEASEDISVANHEIADGKTDGYNTLDELEKATPIIVKGTKLNSELPVLLINGVGDVGGGYTISNFKINDIIKNKSNNTLVIDDIIPIIENDYYDETVNTHFHVNGYVKMIDNNDYLLLLKYAEGNEWYVPIAATYGKVPLNPSEPLFYYGNESMRSIESRDDVRLLEEAREKYE